MLVLQTTDGDHVDIAPEELLEVQLEPGEVEQRGAFGEASEKVVVAVIAVVAPRDGADKGDGVGLVAGSGLSDCVAVLRRTSSRRLIDSRYLVGGVPVSFHAGGLMAGLLSLHRQP